MADVPPDTASLTGKVALITGAARRIGAQIARTLHYAGMNVALHYRRSAAPVHALCRELNTLRADSSVAIAAELRDTAALPVLLRTAEQRWGRLDALINNASAFYPTPIDSVTEEQWSDLIDANLKAPFFLSRLAAPALASCQGCIVNITDIHGDRPLRNHSVYSISKAGLAMTTRALARELAPGIRVNGIAPGAIMWPESGMDEAARTDILARTALKRQGSPEDVARAVLFLLRDAPYVTGQIIAVDGGRSLGG